MSILSALKGIVSKVGSSLSSAASNAANTFSSSPAPSFTSKPAPATPTVNQNMSYLPNISTPYGIGRVQPNGSIILLDNNGRATGSVINSAGVGSTPAPASLLTSRGTIQSTAPTGSPTVESAAVNFNPSIAADTLSSSGPSAPTGGSGASAPSGALPSSPSYTNPGPLNLSGTASALTGMYALNPTTGQLEPVTDATLAAERKKTAESIKNMIPQKDNILQDPAVVAQQAEVDRRQQEVNNFTAQLNQIVAKQNADLLQLRGVGAKEGVTEAVYGGQEAQINREAAIKALPIQAQIAAAQGNLQLAQTHLTDLVKIVTENVDNAYNYKKAQFDWAAQYATGEDKIKLDALNKQNDRLYAEQKDNVNFAQSLMLKAIDSDQSSVAANIGRLLANPASPTFLQDLNTVAGQIMPKTSVVKPEFKGQTLNLGSNEKDAQKIVSDLETVGVTTDDIIQVQKYLAQGYSLDQVAQMSKMPSTIQAAFAKYISEPKLGSALNQ